MEGKFKSTKVFNFTSSPNKQNTSKSKNHKQSYTIQKYNFNNTLKDSRFIPFFERKIFTQQPKFKTVKEDFPLFDLSFQEIDINLKMKKIFSSSNEEDSVFKFKETEEEDDKHRKSKQISPTKSEKEERMKQYKNLLNQKFRLSSKYKTLKMKSKTCEEVLISKENLCFPMLESEFESEKSHIKNENDCDYDDSDTGNWNIDCILSVILNEYQQETFFKEILNENEAGIEQLIDVICMNLSKVMTVTMSLTFMSRLYLFSKNKNKSKKLIDSLEVYSNSYSLNISFQLLNLIIFIYSVSIDDIEYIYTIFDRQNNWETLIFNKFAKNYVEFFIKSKLFVKNPLLFKSLFSLLELNFLKYSHLNYSTLCIQFYVEYIQTFSSFIMIREGLVDLANSRNGIFVVISALRGYNDERNQILLDDILSLLEVFCNGTYSSTLMENVFLKYTEYSAKYLLQYKKEYIFEIISNSNGNFIIQKLINVMKPCYLKRQLLKEIKSKIHLMSKGNVKRKWMNIITGSDGVLSSSSKNIVRVQGNSHGNSKDDC